MTTDADAFEAARVRAAMALDALDEYDRTHDELRLMYSLQGIREDLDDEVDRRIEARLDAAWDRSEVLKEERD